MSDTKHETASRLLGMFPYALLFILLCACAAHFLPVLAAVAKVMR